MAKHGLNVASGLDGAVSKLHKKALEALGQNLVGGEQVLAVIVGPSNQAMIGTDNRVFVYKKGFMAGASFGSELTSWNYQNLVGVQIHTGMMSGAVILQGPGQTGGKTSIWRDSDDDPYKAPNAIPIVRPFDDAKQGVARLRQLISMAHQPVTSSAMPLTSINSESVGSIADELAKLSDLKASGILSDTEFTQLKSRLLGG
ncbi:SHOCT domain-containing protein [Rhodococcus sp. IEGM 1408]|uniref:SHOCT domain-containing protein n=1 Tax=Rhodococcus sp. IEGM 1408 TaxID=3082220 RepID=UPI002952AD9D|nr:SHOCT domain-containing protein [Rhodococcus sp. IEGM 1408]MDV8002773.1 SHOCT domain-containing protein [Rhodococcus sp. IEGM 1408]